MGGRPKGIPKTGGRKEGSINKVTRETKEVITELLQMTAAKYAELFMQKQGDDFMEKYEKLLEFAVPKLSRSEIKAEVKTEITDAISKAFDWTDETDQQEP
jgi:hypothetical protein